MRVDDRRSSIIIDDRRSSIIIDDRSSSIIIDSHAFFRLIYLAPIFSYITIPYLTSNYIISLRYLSLSPDKLTTTNWTIEIKMKLMSSKRSKFFCCIIQTFHLFSSCHSKYTWIVKLKKDFHSASQHHFVYIYSRGSFLLKSTWFWAFVSKLCERLKVTQIIHYPSFQIIRQSRLQDILEHPRLFESINDRRR